DLHDTQDLTAGPGRINQQRSEPLYPPVDRDMIDLHSALGHQLFDIAVGESITELPAHCQQDHLPGEAEAGERRWWREDRTNAADAAHELEHARRTSSPCATVPLYGIWRVRSRLESSARRRPRTSHHRSVDARVRSRSWSSACMPRVVPRDRQPKKTSASA